jgi:hypothetical protein
MMGTAAIAHQHGLSTHHLSVVIDFKQNMTSFEHQSR